MRAAAYAAGRPVEAAAIARPLAEATSMRRQSRFPVRWQHPVVSRRCSIRAGAIGLLGLGMNHRYGLAEADQRSRSESGRALSCIYIFLSGGLSHHDSFDLKPDSWRIPADPHPRGGTADL